ncbi:uncharacterized protein LOC133736085 isoform X1 [Rosa rugosa]|uniref:uncharacterized protein LOC133736085 isoform X1 n=2 Tax=Rosa rugosa TaxID=74645 RepID=UPI002B4121C7|nr:uncharacterized protein LOC133736085 isoform X1 [Rosa rugosa]
MPISENGKGFSSQLGILARDGQKVPLTLTSWTAMPDDVLDDIWKDVKEMCETNKSSRAQGGGVPHRTGRKSFARLRKEMMENGEKIDRVSMFVKTRAMKTRNDDGQPIEVHDEEATAVISQFNEYLRDMPEDEQDDTFREEVFTAVMGEDTHGRVRMYGTGVTPSQVFGNSKTSETTEKKTIEEMEKTIEEMEKKYQTKLDDLKESHESQLGDMKLKYEDVSNHLNLLMAHVGIQVNQSGSTSEQQLRRTIDGHHQLDLEGQQ